MNSKLIKASVAGAAVVALAAGGSTFAAYSDFGNINGNSVGAGILKLDLTSGSGGTAAPLAFGDLAPGMSAYKAVYVASSNGASVPAADLFLTLQNVKNWENGSSSASEAAIDPDSVTADRNSTDTTTASNDDGTKGDLAKVLDMRIETYAAPSSDVCAGYVGSPPGDAGPILVSSVIPNVMGNMANPANLNTPFKLNVAPLTHGQGVCVLFFTYWPTTHVGGTPDNAAQGDSISFDSKFDLVQPTTP